MYDETTSANAHPWADCFALSQHSLRRRTNSSSSQPLTFIADLAGDVFICFYFQVMYRLEAKSCNQLRETRVRKEIVGSMRCI